MTMLLEVHTLVIGSCKTQHMANLLVVVILLTFMILTCLLAAVARPFR